MNNTSSVTSVSSTKSLAITLRKSRGAAMVEYALLLVAVLLLAGASFKTLGRKLNKSVKETHQIL